MNTQCAPIAIVAARTDPSPFPLDQWYVAAFSSEITDKPLGRKLLNHPIVMFRTGDGQVAALEDRCCHRSLPLSCGTVEPAGVRCGYHGMLYGRDGACLEVPGQDRVPAKARVKAYTVQEKNHIVWIWFGSIEHAAPSHPAPDYPHHDNPEYRFGSGVYHYNAPYQLIHDNLLDLSHLGYVHLQTIGGNARQHMHAEMRVEQNGDLVKVTRLMPGTPPAPTYKAAWPFADTCDRWQEIEFHVSHLRIWTGAVVPGTDAIDDPNRGGFHMRGFHGVTPETETTSHYLWSMASNRHPDMADNFETVVEQTKFTFDEDRVVIEAQYRNMQQFGAGAAWVDIHVDAGANRARRIIARLRNPG